MLIALALLAAATPAPVVTPAPATPAVPTAPPAAKPAAPAGGIPLAPLNSEAPDLVPLVPPPAEYTLSLKDGDWRVHVNLRPGEPEPGSVVELRFDVGRAKDIDVGEPQPYNDAKLAMTVTGPGPKQRYLIHALGDAGVYGVHWTPPSRGLWTLSLAPWRDAGPNVTFQVGAGEPMPASSQGHMVQSSRMVVSAGRTASAPSLGVKQLMEDLGKRWLKQAGSPQPDPAELKIMAKLVRAVQGHGQGAEFDNLAAAEATALDKGTLPDAASCLECHAKFRDHWVADLTKWPEVQR